MTGNEHFEAFGGFGFFNEDDEGSGGLGGVVDLSGEGDGDDGGVAVGGEEGFDAGLVKAGRVQDGAVEGADASEDISDEGRELGVVDGQLLGLDNDELFRDGGAAEAVFDEGVGLL